MAKDDKPKDLMHYDALQQEALRGVVKAALKKAAATQGLPGEHHFYISFRTEAPGVSGPRDLLGRYPEEMTIVLQNQFWDLNPAETGFSITLQFGGQPKNLSIPYGAITRFYDPSVQYLLQFAPVETPRAAPAAFPRPVLAATEAEASADAGKAGPAPADQPKIVSLDQFRKK